MQNEISRIDAASALFRWLGSQAQKKISYTGRKQHIWDWCIELSVTIIWYFFEAFNSVQGQIIDVIFNVMSVLLQAQEPLTSPGTNDYV
jgi:hypothetical protein